MENNRDIIFKVKDKWLFLILLIVVSLFYNYDYILGFKPYSIHQWRQADCLSFVDNYYHNGLNFFKPAVNWVGAEKNNKAVSEFPIIYYTVAVFWKFFGKTELIFRLLNLIIVFTGLYYLFLLSKEVLKDKFWSFFIPFFLFSSPIYAYYANNFLADAPALSIVFIAWYYIYKSYIKGKSKYLYIAGFCFALAGLLKISSLLSFISIIGAFVLLRIKNSNDKVVKNQPFATKHIFFSIAIVFLFIIIWYSFAIYYNQCNNNGLFLQGILPIWELEGWKIKEVAMRLYNEILPSFFNITSLFITLLLFIFTLLNFKKNNIFFLYTTLFTILGTIGYIVLFFQVFDVHDYYLVNMLVFIPLIILNTLYYIKERHVEFFHSKPIKVVSFILLFCNIYYTAVNTRMKYNSNDLLVENTFIIPKIQKDYWNWYHWDYKEHYKALETITPYLRSIGLKRDDFVISMPDQSINITLYLMEQKGFTDFGYSGLNNSQRVEKFKSLGAKYLIVNNPSIYGNPELQCYFKNKIGSYKNVDIYKL